MLGKPRKMTLFKKYSFFLYRNAGWAHTFSFYTTQENNWISGKILIISCYSCYSWDQDSWVKKEVYHLVKQHWPTCRLERGRRTFLRIFVSDLPITVKLIYTKLQLLPPVNIFHLSSRVILQKNTCLIPHKIGANIKTKFYQFWFSIFNSDVFFIYLFNGLFICIIPPMYYIQICFIVDKME